MPNYSTIKELVIDTCLAEGQFPSYEKLTSLVLQNFPNSKWKKTHYAWYKSKIKGGEIVVPDFESSHVSTVAFEEGAYPPASQTILVEREVLPLGAAHALRVEPAQAATRAAKSAPSAGWAPQLDGGRRVEREVV